MQEEWWKMCFTSLVCRRYYSILWCRCGANPSCSIVVTLFLGCDKLEGQCAKEWNGSNRRGKWYACLGWDIGCRIGTLPMSYLGMPLRASHKSPSIWNLFWKKLSESWPGRRTCICLRGVDWRCSRVRYLVFLLTFYHFSLFILMWLTKLKSFKRTFYGVIPRVIW